MNKSIATAQQFTAPRPDGLPVIDRSAQADFGLDMARRAAQRSQQPVDAPKPMPPIVPMAS